MRWVRVRGDYEAANALYVTGCASQRKRCWRFKRRRSAIQKLLAAHLALGSANEERRNDGEAIAAYARVLALEAKNVTALRSASKLYLKNGLHTKALPLLETLVAISPGLPDARADLGAVYAAGGN